jgi:hypothetical protein
LHITYRQQEEFTSGPIPITLVRTACSAKAQIRENKVALEAARPKQMKQPSPTYIDEIKMNKYQSSAKN